MPPLKRMYRIVSHLSLALTLLALLYPTMGEVTAQGEILLDDQFENNQNQWESFGSVANITLQDGVLQLQVDAENYVGSALPAQSFPSDILITAEVRPQLTDPQNTNWSVSIITRVETRAVDSNMIEFGIEGTGEWVLRVSDNPDESTKALLRGSLPDFDPSSPMKLGMAVSGDIFTLLYNDQVLAVSRERILNTPAEIYAGVMVGTYEGLASIAADFTRFTVSAIPEEMTHITPAEGGDEGVLFADDFQSNESGWVFAGWTGNALWEDGQLILEVEGEDSYMMMTPEVLLPLNYVLEVTIRANNIGSEDTQWNAGVVVQSSARSKFGSWYQLDFEGDGGWTFSIHTTMGETYDALKSGTIAGFSPAEAHVVRIEVQEGSFTYFVDGEQIGIFKDQALTLDPSGNFIGLVVGTFAGQEKISVSFSKLSVTALP
ncbi:MAG: hypothetical protein IAE83_17560 [Anaerolinea sp.]|nr:hypothetical protein [Anaerolinea sp.]